MKVYFVTVGLQEEIEVIRKVRPPRVLCSYWYFKNRSLREFCNSIGYRPEILLDSGAYSAFTKGKSVNILDYMEYIKANRDFISCYIAMDVIGDSFTTKAFYDLMRAKEFVPVPVFHYGDDYSTMDHYVASGALSVALGNTARIRDKNLVAKWCEEVHSKYPKIKLHLLGSSSRKIMEVGVVDSCDSSAWYIMAVNGKPVKVPGKGRMPKIFRAEENMIRTMEVFDEVPVPFDNCCVEHPHGEV
jgi:hypothetical protein